MLEEGYFQGRTTQLTRLAPKLADAVRIFNRNNIPPAFLFLFDEAWDAYASLLPLVDDLLPNARVLPDFWVWHVDPAAGEAGWNPHVDKGLKALDAQGNPLSLTIWIPLSRAIPANGCMYILPANRDPEYGLGLNKRTKPIDLPLFRALPGEPGDFFMWNQAVLHWGSATSRFADEPRISMALEFQSGDVPAFNQPLIDPEKTIDFESRLRLVGKQILQYRHMYQVAPEFEALAKELLAG